MGLEDQLLQEFRALEPAQRRLVAEFVHFLSQKRTAPEEKTMTSPVSVYDLLKEQNVLGTIEGPEDLSTNKAYFEGFGQ